ncbi:MAG: hypothetical protein FJY88_02070 [Candidatus Eisenbacteria bacterium]|nr:hypothetical protein [Candidatus Eisenbacteria bacterium]
MGTSIGLVIVSAFPILGIVFGYGIYCALAAEHDGVANRLAFVFAVAAFATLLSMLMAQMAVSAGAREMTKGLDDETGKALRRALRLIDLGLDVAWDFLMATAMIFWGVAMRGRRAFGPWWGIPMVVLGVALMGLNAATFPWPPGSHGSFDLGPLAAVFLMALAVRLIFLGRRTAA